MKTRNFFFILIFFIFSLTSCSVFNPAREIRIEKAKKRIANIIEKYPELSKTRRDTLLIPMILSDTIYIPDERTIVTQKITKDTIRIETERAKLKLLVKKESVFVDLLVKADTIIKTDTVYIEHILEQNTINLERNCDYCIKKYKNRIYIWSGIVLFFIFVSFIIFYIIKKYLKI